VCCPEQLVGQVLAAFLGGVAAWFGDELVDRLGFGVDQDLHADTPQSLVR
jgi:hypothetical protein